MSPAGRPELSESEKRNVIIHIRVTQEEKEKFERISKEHGMKNLSEAFRYGMELLRKQKKPKEKE